MSEEIKAKKNELINLGKYVFFLKWFDEKLKNYSKIVIQFDLLDKRTGFLKKLCYKRVEIKGDDIKEHSYDICDMLVDFAKYKIVACSDSIYSEWFCIYDDDFLNEARYIFVTCEKKEIYK